VVSVTRHENANIAVEYSAVVPCRRGWMGEWEGKKVGPRKSGHETPATRFMHATQSHVMICNKCITIERSIDDIMAVQSVEMFHAMQRAPKLRH
jgi:hypothetical protein